MTKIKQSTDNSRITVIDALRGFALLGVVLVHMQHHFNIYNIENLNMHESILGAWDSYIEWFTSNVITGRFINIFAFLFGLSFFIQMNRASQKGIDLRRRFMWRMVILFVIGLFNTCFYTGDILTLYAVYGIFLLLLNSCRNWMLVLLSVILLSGTPKLCIYVFENIKPKLEQVEDVISVQSQEIDKVNVSSSFINSAKKNLTTGIEEKLNYQYQMTNRGYITLAIFILGLVVGRIRFFETIYLRKRRNAMLFVVFVLGVFVFNRLSNLIVPATISVAMSDVATVCFSAAMIMAFIILYNIPIIGKCLNLLAPYGRMGLTNYVLQSIIGCIIFSSWAWGATFGSWSSTELFLLGLCVYVVQIIVSTVWLRFFKYGPMEWLWRSATYLKWQSFNK